MSMTDWFPTCEVRVARNDNDLEKLRVWFDAKLEPPENTDGCMWFLEGKGCRPCAVVWIDHKVSGNDLYSLIAHEATHCATDYMHSIGETEFSSEFIAYTVESFFSEILSKVVE